jgi:hypothetical protein
VLDSSDWHQIQKPNGTPADGEKPVPLKTICSELAALAREAMPIEVATTASTAAIKSAFFKAHLPSHGPQAAAGGAGGPRIDNPRVDLR